MVVDEAWVELKTEDGRTYFWNRRANSRAWALPEGISIKWVGQKSPDGRTYYWSRESKETVWVLPPLTGAPGDAADEAAVVGQGEDGHAGTTPGGAGNQLPSPAPASFPTAGPAATVVAGEDGALVMEKPEETLPCVFPEIEPPGPRGDSASAVAARHMIVASGCDSWFHWLPSGEWEEVLRFWPPAADLMLAAQPKIRNARPDPYGLRELIMRCQKHEELVRALLVAQCGNADGFSAAKFPCPQECDWCFWKQDGTQLVINADKPQPVVDAACMEPTVPIVKRCPPEGERWRLLKTGLRSSLCMLFRAKQLRKLERAIQQEEKSTVQSLLSLLSSDVPEKLARAAQKLLVPMAPKPLPPEKPHEPEQSSLRTVGRVAGFAPAMVPYHQSGISKAASGAATTTFAPPGTMPPLITPLRPPPLGTPCGTLPGPLPPGAILPGQADSQLPLRPQGASPSPFAKRAVFKAVSMPVAGAAPDASGEAASVGSESMAELASKAPSPLAGALEFAGKAGSLSSAVEKFAKMQPPEFLSKAAGMPGALSLEPFAKSMPSGARFAGKAQAEAPGFVAGKAPSAESGWNGNQGSPTTAVGNFGKSYAILPPAKGDLYGMAAALAAKVEAFGKGTGAAGALPVQAQSPLFTPPPTKAPPSSGVPQWKAPPATEPADAPSTEGFAAPALPLAPFVPVLPPPKAAPTGPVSSDAVLLGGTEPAAVQAVASPAPPQPPVPVAPPLPAPDPEASAKVAAAAFAAAAAGDRSSEAVGEKKRAAPTCGADGGPATEAPWKKRRRNTRSNDAPVEQASKEKAAVESAAAPPQSAKVGKPESRKVVVGSLPTEMKAEELADFFTGAIFSATGHTLAAQWQSGEASKVIVEVDLAPNGASAEVTFGTALGATVAVALNGIQFQGKTLDIKRPKNFGGPPLQRSKLQNLSLKDLIASDGTDKEASTKSKAEALGAAVVAAGGDDGSGATVRLSGVPSSMSSKSVFDLLQQFGGPLRSLDLSADKASGEHQGHGVAEYEDRSHALEAVRFSPLLGFIEIKMIAVASTNAGIAQAAGSPPSAKRERRTRFDPTEAGEDLGPFEAALQQREQVKAMEDEPLDLGPFEAVLPPKRGVGTTSALLQDGNR